MVAGENTTLISGPVNLDTPPHVTRIDVQSADQMLEQCEQACSGSDIFIACAAVADYRPAHTQQQKIKKGPEHMSIEMVRNADIVATIANSDSAPFTVGFAAETNDVVSYAREKMLRKQLDMIVSNDVSGSNIGFNSDNNEVTVIWPGGERALALSSKASIARQIIALIADQITAASRQN